MEALLSVFAANQGTVHEEAMLAVGALTYACGTSFAKYLNHLFPIIEMGLKNTAVWSGLLFQHRCAKASTQSDSLG